jgi:peroxiredoxin
MLADGKGGDLLAPAKIIFTLYLVFRRTERWLALHEPSKADLRGEVEALLARRKDSVTMRGVYSAAGFRPDSDVVFWLLSPSVDDLQDTAVALRRAAFGRATDLSWAFLGVTHEPEYVGDHYASFQQDKPPLKYLCLYPFVRTIEWYLLPAEERGRILKAHAELARDFSDVQTNNVQAFGLGDYEWLLAFEADRMERFTALVRRLREAEARRYAKLEIPFIVGRRKAVAEALADLG